MVTGTKSKVGFAALAMAVVMMVASPALAGSNLNVQGVTTSGCTVTVTVKNTSLLLSYGTVRAEAVVSGTTMTKSSSVLLLPGQTANVSLKFGGTVGSLLSVGITDDAAPM